MNQFYKRFHTVFLIGAGTLIALGAVLLYGYSRPTPPRLTQRDIDAAVARVVAKATPQPSYASQVYEIIHPSVVRIQALHSTSDENMDTSLGSGVVIDDSGSILAALHIVRDATAVRIVFADGTESEAQIVTRQAENDLVVLRPSVVPDDLVPATMGNSQALRVGDEVVAVGNPFGINNSLSSGVISGLGRNYRSPSTGEVLTNLIQFDAAVNPGNSGGPLLDRRGEVVGIVTGLLNPNNGEFFIGIGFAVPIETAAAIGGPPPF